MGGTHSAQIHPAPVSARHGGLVHGDSESAFLAGSVATHPPSSEILPTQHSGGYSRQQEPQSVFDEVLQFEKPKIVLQQHYRVVDDARLRAEMPVGTLPVREVDLPVISLSPLTVQRLCQNPSLNMFSFPTPLAPADYLEQAPRGELRYRTEMISRHWH